MTATSKAGCERAERVAEYALRALPASERSAFEAHVDGCAECRQQLLAVRPVIDTFVDWPTDILRPSPGLWGAVKYFLRYKVAHAIGLDRAIGYGLKYPTDFKDTHLGRIGGLAK